MRTRQSGHRGNARGAARPDVGVPAAARLLYLDNLKVVLIALIIALHAASS